MRANAIGDGVRQARGGLIVAVQREIAAPRPARRAGVGLCEVD
jgi:hypothetical protein